MNYIINGQALSREHNFCARYEELIEAYCIELGRVPGRVLTVTWVKPDGCCGTITPGQELIITDGTRINVADTSSA